MTQIIGMKPEKNVDYCFIIKSDKARITNTQAALIAGSWPVNSVVNLVPEEKEIITWNIFDVAERHLVTLSESEAENFTMKLSIPEWADLVCFVIHPSVQDNELVMRLAAMNAGLGGVYVMTKGRKPELVEITVDR